MLLAAGVYVQTDTTLSFRSGADGAAGVTWLAVWWCLLAFQMVYGKHLTQAHGDMSETERVFYTNVLSLPPTAVLCVLMGEHKQFHTCVSPTRNT